MDRRFQRYRHTFLLHLLHQWFSYKPSYWSKYALWNKKPTNQKTKQNQIENVLKRAGSFKNILNLVWKRSWWTSTSIIAFHVGHIYSFHQSTSIHRFYMPKPLSFPILLLSSLSNHIFYGSQYFLLMTYFFQGLHFYWISILVLTLPYAILTPIHKCWNRNSFVETTNYTQSIRYCING